MPRTKPGLSRPEKPGAKPSTRRRSGPIGLDEVLGRLLEDMLAAFPVERATLHLTGHGQECLALTAGRSSGNARKHVRRVAAPVSRLAAQAVADGRLRMANDAAKNPFSAPSVAAGLRSQACLPLVKDGHVLGVIDLASDHTGTFAAEMLPELRAFADEAAQVIDQVTVYDHARDWGEKLEALLESSDAGIIMTDPRHIIQIANKRVADLLGLDPEGLIGQRAPGPILEVLRSRAADPHQVERLLTGAYTKAGRTVKEEVELVRPAGATLSVFTTPLHARAGEVTGRLVALRDISWEREAQARLRAASEAALALSSSLDLNSVLSSLGKAIGKHVPFDQLSVATVDQEGKTFQPLALIGRLDQAHSDRGGGSLEGTRTGRAVEVKAPVLSRDLQANPDEFVGDRALLETDLRCVLCLPLIFGDTCLGTFNLGSAKPNAFDETTISFLTPIVDHLAVAVNNATLRRQACARAEQNAALNRTLHAAATSTTPGEFVPQLATELSTVVPLDHLCLALETATGGLELAGARPEGPGPQPWNVTLRSVPPPETAADEGLAAALWGADACFSLTVPLGFRGRLLGSLSLSRNHRQPFTPAEQDFAERMAGQVSGMIENVRFYTKLREEADVLTALLEVAQRVARRDDLRSIFSAAANCMVKVLGYDGMAVCVHEPGHRTPRTIMRATRTGGEVEVTGVEPLSEIAADFATLAGSAGTDEVVFIEDAAKLTGLSRCFQGQFRVRSAIVGLMRSGEDQLGALLIGYSGPAEFSEKHEQLVKGLAGQLASAIQESRLTRRLERKVSELTAIGRASHHLTAILDLPTLLNEVVVFLTKDLGHDYSAVFLHDRESEELRLYAQAGTMAKDVPDGFTQSVNVGMAGWVARNGQPLVANDVGQDPVQASVAGLASRARMCLPLKVGDDVLGVLDLESRTPGAFIEDEVDAIGTLSRQLAIAIHNATVFKRERDLYMAAIKTLAEAVDARDHRTRAHSSRVSHYALMIAREMNLPAETLPTIEYAGVLHDIGKIGLEDTVLKKKGALDPLERAQVMEHPVKGANILQQVAQFREIVPLVKHHHEWWAGGGYPDGISGEAIPLGSRILAVADSFDAMTTDRPYRLGLRPEEAITRLQAGRGTQFDPTVVDHLVTHLRRLQEERDPAYAVLERPGGRGPLEAGPPKPETTIGRILPVHGKELGILYQISLETRSLLNPSHLMHRILSILYDAMGPNLYTLFLVDEETGDLVAKASVGLPTGPERPHILKGQGLTGWVAQHGLPQVVGDVRSDPRYYPSPARRMLSELAVPLVAEGRTIGVLDIESEPLNAFSREDLYLVSAVAGQISIAIEVARYHEQVAHAAIHDGLTGTYNHSYFYRRLEEEISRSAKDMAPLAIILIDVDSLKLINDVYGHLAGDKALVALARALDESFRATDTVARYGGDEFAVILPRTGANEARQAAERLAATVADRSISLQEREFRLPGVTVGVAIFPDDGARPAELVARADERMYEGKQAKRPSVAAGQ